MKPVDLKVAKALVVEVIKTLWGQGLYRDNKWLWMCHNNWMPFWLDWRTDLTMSDVDRQIEEMFHESKIEPPLYWEEEEEGETPLGGALGYSYDFVDRSRGGADSLQGAEQRQTDGNPAGDQS